jgi:uncharacterized membrane protein YhaH (DUF805 family)
MDSNITALKTYINTQRENGISDQATYQALLASGWQHELLVQALSPQDNATGLSQVAIVPTPPADVESTTLTATEHGLHGGRLNRRGFVMAHVYILAYFVLALLLVMLGRGSSVMNVIGFLLGGIGVVVAMILPFFFYARRWHDVNQSGWLSLLLLIPGAVAPIMIILLILPGTRGLNQFGVAPQKSLSPADVYGLRN